MQYDWQSTDDNEGRANIYVHESQETGQDKGRKSLSFWLFPPFFTGFEENV